MSSTKVAAVKDLVWVVDADESTRGDILDYLEIQGYRVQGLDSGLSMLEMLEATLPDAIIFTIENTEKEGLRICRTIKENPEISRVPVLLITSTNERKIRLKATVSGANEVISKPLDLQYLALRVRNAVNIKKLYDELQDSYKKLQELEALKQSLVQMIVHDFRTPLMTTSMALELAKADWTPLEDKTPYIVQAEKSNDQLLNLVNDLLDVGKMEEGKMTLTKTEVHLADLIGKSFLSLSFLAQKKNIDFTTELEDCIVSAEEKLLERVIENLLTNALKYTPPDGSVCIRAFGKENRIRVEVQDNGDGIADEDKTVIFEKFGQVKARQKHRKYSTGLGLTFCKLVIEEHGGTIGVESELEKGSLFWFELEQHGLARPRDGSSGR